MFSNMTNYAQAPAPAAPSQPLPLLPKEDSNKGSKVQLVESTNNPASLLAKNDLSEALQGAQRDMFLAAFRETRGLPGSRVKIVECAEPPVPASMMPTAQATQTTPSQPSPPPPAAAAAAAPPPPPVATRKCHQNSHPPWRKCQHTAWCQQIINLDEIIIVLEYNKAAKQPSQQSLLEQKSFPKIIRPSILQQQQLQQVSVVVW
jgi:hypothetical protein